jgi:hypothetical protein
MVRPIFLTLALALAALTMSTANGQLSDDFDSYANGTLLNGVNGWQGWDNVAGVVGSVTNAFSNSAPNSVQIDPLDDCVNQMGSPSDGVWQFSCVQFIPSSATGLQYFIMQNDYNDFGPYNWSVQHQFNTDSNVMLDEFDTAWPGAPIVFDTWIEIQVYIDFDNDVCEIRIDLNGDGTLDDDGADNVSQTADDELTSWSNFPWSTRAFDNTGNGTTDMGALDLYSPGGTTCYYDDIVFEEVVVGGPVHPDSFTTFRGVLVSGNLNSVLASDDSDLCHQPGITLFPTEAPVTIDFVGTLPDDTPASISATVESTANTVGLGLTFRMWKFTGAPGWQTVGTSGQTNNVDTVRTFNGVVADHVQVGTGEVRLRYEVRRVSFVFLFPWTDCIDEVFWTAP